MDNLINSDSNNNNINESNNVNNNNFNNNNTGSAHYNSGNTGDIGIDSNYINYNNNGNSNNINSDSNNNGNIITNSNNITSAIDSTNANNFSYANSFTNANNNINTNVIGSSNGMANNNSNSGNYWDNYWSQDQVRILQFSMSYVNLRSLCNWATFRAVIDIILGAVSCLGIITAAYGIPQIVSAVKLLNTVTLLRQYMVNNDTKNIAECFYRLNEYFKLKGITTIVKVVISVLVFIMWLFIFYIILQYDFVPFKYDNYNKYIF